jgi:hypothetical protein
MKRASVYVPDAMREAAQIQKRSISNMVGVPVDCYLETWRGGTLPEGNGERVVQRFSQRTPAKPQHRKQIHEVENSA